MVCANPVEGDFAAESDNAANLRDTGVRRSSAAILLQHTPRALIRVAATRSPSLIDHGLPAEADEMTARSSCSPSATGCKSSSKRAFPDPPSYVIEAKGLTTKFSEIANMIGDIPGVFVELGYGVRGAARQDFMSKPMHSITVQVALILAGVSSGSCTRYWPAIRTWQRWTKVSGK